MNKEEIFRELSVKISVGEISADEVLSRFGGNAGANNTEVEKKNESSQFSVVKMLYVLGAVIVVIGILFFVGQIWDDMGSSSRIAITLGLGLLFTVGGSILTKQETGSRSLNNDAIGSVFYAIGGMLIPGGAMVALSEFSVEVVSLWPVTLTFGAIFLFYLLLNYAQKNAILTFFTIANGTAFTYLLVESIVDGPSYMHEDLYAYLTMVVGISYLLLAQSFKDGWNKKLVSVLYFFGSAGILAGAFSQVFDSIIWRAMYFFLVMGGVFLSTHLRSRAILTVSTIFLIAHLVYITSEYFADSLGWPITLIFLGLVFIGLGYASININKKYIAKGN